MKVEKLSAVIITYNEEKNIARCLASLKGIADEIIVLDSFSPDRTVEIASEQGALVWQEPFRGYIEQKNKAIELASYNYILSIDADEEIRFIRHGIWYPDKKTRLFDKRVASWGGLNPHDTIVFKRPTAIKQLQGEILHYSFATLKEHVNKNERFSSIVAKSYFKAGKKTNLFRIIVNPTWAFINGFFFKKGFLDGKSGFIIAWKQAGYTFLKHKKLFQLQSGRKQIIQSDIQSTAHTDRLTSNIRTHTGS